VVVDRHAHVVSAAPQRAVQADDASRLITYVGLGWLGLVVTLLVITFVRVRAAAREEASTSGSALALEHLDSPREKPLGPRLPLPTLSRHAAGQVVPVVSPAGARLHVPEIVGLTAQSTARREQRPDISVLLQVGSRAGNVGQHAYAMLAIAVGVGGTAPSDYGLEWVTQRIATDAARGLAGAQPVSPSGVLKQTFAELHEDLRDRNLQHQTTHGLTVIAAVLMDGVAHIVSIGDSRAYVYSPFIGLRQITTDHSIVAALVTTRLLAPEALYTHPRRGYLYRCLGLNAQSQPDAFHVPLQRDDRLMLCTDTLWQTVRNSTTETILRGSPEPQQAGQRLMAMALQGSDRSRLGLIVARPLGNAEQRVASGVSTGHLGQEEAMNPRGIAPRGQ
jgi:protein phosphatase